MDAPGALWLHAGELRLALRPDLGGSVAGLWAGDRALWRSCEPAALQGPRQSGCFPLVPYSNRLAHRRFDWQGQTHTTAPNFDNSPHSLHGVGWLRAWSVVAHCEAHATLVLRHTPDADWPFAFEAQQTFDLDSDGLRMGLSVRNTDTREQPMGLGWHPYFPRTAGARIDMAVTRRWDSEPTGLPTAATPIAGLHGTVGDMAWDHCFDGWDGQALIDMGDGLRLRLASDLNRAVVFTPPGRDIFCIEPVSHVNDALHAADALSRGLRILSPGDSTAAHMSLTLIKT